MPHANPLVEDQPGNIPVLAVSGGARASALSSAASVEGEVELGDGSDLDHETNLWYAGVMVLALLGLVALHITGFRFSTDVGVTRG